MDKIAYLNLALRLTVWLLLTADLSWPNVLLGLAIALLLPQAWSTGENVKDWLQALGKILLAIPQAFAEAIEIMLRPHRREVMIKQKVKSHRSPGLIFLDIFLITFTPKTIVTKYDDRGWYKVHEIKKG